MANLSATERLDGARQHFVATLNAVVAKKADAEIVFVSGRRGQGMSMFSAYILWQAVAHGKAIYVNFELPQWAKEAIGKYATIERVDAKPNDD